MPNLDELTHDMTFTVGGETFIAHDVHPEVLIEFDKDPEKEETEEETLARMDRQILGFLNGDPEAVKRYKKIRAKTYKPPVPAWKIIEFRNLLMESQTARPTTPPTPSAPGPGKTARTSGAA